MSTTDTTDTAVEADAPVLLAVSYLRVSTREQAERGGTEEGFSIPAQREANARKAADLGANVVREFVDAGESARSADRDGLQDMLGACQVVCVNGLSRWVGIGLGSAGRVRRGLRASLGL